MLRAWTLWSQSLHCCRLVFILDFTKYDLFSICEELAYPKDDGRCYQKTTRIKAISRKEAPSQVWFLAFVKFINISFFLLLDITFNSHISYFPYSYLCIDLSPSWHYFKFSPFQYSFLCIDDHNISHYSNDSPSFMCII